MIQSLIIVFPIGNVSAVSIILNPTDDSIVHANHPDNNTGSEPGYVEYLGVSQNPYDSNPGPYEISYIKFDLSGIPLTSTINSAYLKVYLEFIMIIYPDPDPCVRILRSTDISWSENEITWNNKPSYTYSTYDDVEILNDADEDSYINFELTEHIQNALPAGKVTFVMDTCSAKYVGVNCGFRSKEYSLMPRLEISYSPAVYDPPVADFSWGPANPSVGEEVSFDDRSTPGSGTINTWSWKFDDGATSTLENPTHIYTNPGTYSINLTISDSYGLSDSITHLINIESGPQPPIANFSWVSNRFTVDFTDQSVDTDGSVVAWIWNFGDENISNQQNPSHTYSAEGDYTVNLNVTDNDGTSDSVVKLVHVELQPPIANFTWISNRLEINFTDQSIDTDGTIVVWDWDFDDGNSSNERNASHSYTHGGDYTVTLTVTDNDGLTDYRFRSVFVDSEPPSNVTGLSVTDAKDGKLNLVWNVASDNIAVDHYNIYRNNVFLLNRTSTSYQDTGLINGQSYNYTISAVDTSRNEGNISNPVSGTPTKSSTPYTPPSESDNKKPVADASAGEPYQGFVNSEITFDASKSYDPDGTITKWVWNFGDNTNGNGKTIKHTYSKAGTYATTLTVTDNNGATHTDTTTCMIFETSSQSNRPPFQPIITGPTVGTKNTLYNYTAQSWDADKDEIKYTFYWGDIISAPQSSGFLPEGSNFTVKHGWAAAGRYNITVTVTDNKSESSYGIFVYIDAVQTRGFGYLLDNDSDGLYDAFYSDEFKQITKVQKLDDNYLIDSNGDGETDYTYSAVYGIVSYQEQESSTSWLESNYMLVVIAVVLIVGAVGFFILWKKDYF